MVKWNYDRRVDVQLVCKTQILSYRLFLRGRGAALGNYRDQSVNYLKFFQEDECCSSHRKINDCQSFFKTNQLKANHCNPEDIR